MTKTRSQSPEGLSLTVRRTYPATPERIFRAFTDPADLKQWFCPTSVTLTDLEAEAVVGGKLRVVMQAPDGARYIANGIFKEVHRPEKVVFTWQWESGMDGFTGDTTVTVDIRAVEDGTEVVMTHEGLPTEKQRDGHMDGWESVLEHLAQKGL